MIDIKAILDDLGIDYKHDGKNVGSNDVNVDCPFCGADKHLGISLSKGLVNCWVCDFDYQKPRPTLLSVLREASGLSWEEITAILSDYGWESGYRPDEDEGESYLAKECSLPKSCISIFSPSKVAESARLYLMNRGFSENHMSKYMLQVATSGAYSGRIIIPIYMDGKLVSFTGRRFTRTAGSRYKHAILSMSSTRIGETLYNYDSARGYKHVYIVEGPTDVWKIGNDSLGTMRARLSSKQRKLLFDAGIKSATICFDKYALNHAVKAADSLLSFMNKVKVIEFPDEKDVGEMSRDEILSLERTAISIN